MLDCYNDGCSLIIPSLMNWEKWTEVMSQDNNTMKTKNSLLSLNYIRSKLAT